MENVNLKLVIVSTILTGVGIVLGITYVILFAAITNH